MSVNTSSLNLAVCWLAPYLRVYFHGNVSKPEQVKRPNAWMMISILYLGHSIV